MEIEAIVHELIRDYLAYEGCSSTSVYTMIHMEDFKKVDIARSLRKKGYRLDSWILNRDTDHYGVCIDRLKGS